MTLFARYDQLRLKKNTDPSLRNTYFNLGLQYKIRRGIVAALVYKHERKADDLHTTHYEEIGLFSRIAF